MSSGFPGGHPDYLHLNPTGRSIPLTNFNNNVVPNGYRSPLAGILSDSSSNIGLRRPDLIGKRSLAEFQHHQQLQQQAAFFLRNVKHRSYNNNNNTTAYASPVSPISLIDFPTSPEISTISSVSNNTTSSGYNININNISNNIVNNNNHPTSSASAPRYGVPVMQPFNLGNGSFNGVNSHTLRNGYPRVTLPVKLTPASNETEGKMMKRLQELEKELLLDDEDGENNVSGVTNSEWSETYRNIITPAPVVKPENVVSPSPTSSSSSSCASSSASPATGVSPTQLFSDAAGAIADGKTDAAVEIMNRISQVSNAVGTPEQRLSFYMTSALRSRLSMTSSDSSELYGKDHIVSTQLLYENSLCFKLAFMAANAAIVDLAMAEKTKNKKIHIVDFDIGKGNQYIYLLQDIAAACEADTRVNISIRLTTFADYGNGGRERLIFVCDGLKSVADKLGVCFCYDVWNLSLFDVNATSLKVESEESLVVNLGFKLYKLPDESVSTENVRDELLRRVKGLSPALVTVVEQELNANTASFETRVSQVSGYYGALMESLDSAMGRDDSDRVKIEEGLSRKMTNSVACEGKNRVERCEVFGKWRARMNMAGFELKPMSQLRAESLLSKVNSVGFTAKEEAGGISFGWMGRTLTVASVWH
ncbi:putative transcription factor GRAS family [Helianthus annuus]|nr:putative transcription factor GRAS family [Helianthus annuus]KAJ0479980.1 putative transcription factor GRAS family [Helianthus annuus]KAJ0662788.1 putative transcription factor GRAS family [Helianthus annuus]KAJ0670301.1 putative transcription factor GRAS family [Helianthus annuus]KAJ0857109.1 putative transcription factor GRAS family [Helianthus annuus]